jgi:phage shock protein C
MEKKFKLSTTDKKLAGVCGGIAEYLNMDPSVVRVLWAIISLCAGTGVLAYIIRAFVIPEKPDDIIDAV